LFGKRGIAVEQSGQFYLLDTGSSNGTFVNNIRHSDSQHNQPSIFAIFLLPQLRGIKGIVQPFELGGGPRLIPSDVKTGGPESFLKINFIVQSHERSIKPFSAA
jgi:hypothetical protein